jgi:hypothetical protein
MLTGNTFEQEALVHATQDLLLPSKPTITNTLEPGALHKLLISQLAASVNALPALSGPKYGV